MKIPSFKEFLIMEEQTEQNIGTYVSMKVKNADELYDWFYSQGVDMVPMEELHCTISYSRKTFTHIVNEDEVTITPNQFLEISPLGDEGAVVLKFDSIDMQSRFNQCMEEGATYDYDSYIPHITLTYNGKDLDISKLKIPNFSLTLFNETVEPLDLDWKDKVQKDSGIINELNKNVNEMAFLNDIPAHSNLDKSDEWNRMIKDSPFTKLLVKDVNANKNDIYIYGTSMFYLIDKDKQYLGHLELSKDDDVGVIASSFSKIKGFYLLMFPNILEYSDIKTILSDTSLSQGAINSYNKLHKIVGDNNRGVSTFKMSVLSHNKTLPYSEDNLLRSRYNRVMITEQHFRFIKESFDHRITLVESMTKRPGFWKQKWDSNHEVCDQWLYGIA